MARRSNVLPIEDMISAQAASSNELFSAGGPYQDAWRPLLRPEAVALESGSEPDRLGLDGTKEEIMVRAIVRNGVVEPLVRLPTTWSDGQELVIAEPGSLVERVATEDELNAWARDVEVAMAEIPLEDHELFEQALAEHEREAKKQVRRAWGLA
jgi:hypothetical protein